MEPISFSSEIGLTLLISLAAFVLFISDKFSTDINALILLVCLGLVNQLPFIQPLLPDNQLFSGFSSAAVIAVIALMILAAGIERTGGMDAVARGILNYCGNNRGKLIATFCLIAGVMSGFVQNIGVVALCLPVASYLSLHSGVPAQQLILPMGFCVILGGNLSLLGNSSLIILNDLIASSSQLLSSDQENTTLDLFATAPAGICLLAAGIFYFAYFGKSVLSSSQPESKGDSTASLVQRFGLSEIAVVIPIENTLVAKTVAELEEKFDIQIIALDHPSKPDLLAPFRSTHIEADAKLGLIGGDKAIKHFLEANKLHARSFGKLFGKLTDRLGAGYSEVVVSGRSPFLGKTFGELMFRKFQSATPVLIQRQSEVISGGQVSHTELCAGDVILLFSESAALERFADRDSLILTHTECPTVAKKHQQGGIAAGIFIGSILLTIATPIPTSLCLWAGVLGMFLSGIIKPGDAYQSVSWKTVILLAGMIPLGIALDHTGAAGWLGQCLSELFKGSSFALQLVIVALTTLLTLIMSNVGATILLVPVALNIAVSLGENPWLWILLVGVASSNSFLLPTHQANALIMSAGRYKVADFVRIGGGVTLVYIAIELLVLNLMF